MRAHIAFVAAFAAIGLGCSGTTSTDTTAALLPPTLVAHALDCNAVAPGSDTAEIRHPLVRDDATLVPVAFTPTNVTLRPPGGCIGILQCGHFVALVDGVVTGASTSALVDEVPVAPGDHTIRIELRDDAEAAFLTATIAVRVAAMPDGGYGACPGCPVASTGDIDADAACDACSQAACKDACGGTTRDEAADYASCLATKVGTCATDCQGAFDACLADCATQAPAEGCVPACVTNRDTCRMTACGEGGVAEAAKCDSDHAGVDALRQCEANAGCTTCTL